MKRREKPVVEGGKVAFEILAGRQGGEGLFEIEAEAASATKGSAKALHHYRRRWGWRWYVDEVFCFRGGQKRSLDRAVDQHGQVVDILRRDQRDRASALAFFRRALRRTGMTPHPVVSDHHRAYLKAVATTAPTARHIRTGLHRARGETTKPIERSYIATRDRLRSARGPKTGATGQRFLE